MRAVRWRNRTASQDGWNIRNTRGRGFFAGWLCLRFWLAAITPRSRAGEGNNQRPGASAIPGLINKGQRQAKELAMKNDIMTLVEESGLKESPPEFDIG